MRALLGQGGKDLAGSLAAREEGNAHFQAKRLREALACYTRAVLAAPCPGEELSLALVNRAAVLGRAAMHREVVEDLSLALEDGGYPSHLHYKAWQRLAVANEGLGRTVRAREAYTRLLDSLDHSDVPTGKLAKMREDAARARDTLEQQGRPPRDEGRPPRDEGRPYMAHGG